MTLTKNRGYRASLAKFPTSLCDLKKDNNRTFVSIQRTKVMDDPKASLSAMLEKVCSLYVN